MAATWQPDGPSNLASDGDPGRIRTCDPVLRRHVLYPAELPGPRLGRCEAQFRRTWPLRSRRPNFPPLQNVPTAPAAGQRNERRFPKPRPSNWWGVLDSNQ